MWLFVQRNSRHVRRDCDDLEVSVFEQMNLEPSDEDEESDERSLVELPIEDTRLGSLRHLTLQILQSPLLHSSMCPGSDGWEDRRDPSRQPLVVVLVEEMEAFPAALLADLVHILALNRRLGLRIRLLLGLATADFAVPERLRQETVALLALQTFAAPAPSKCLAAALAASEEGLSGGPHLLMLSHE